MATKNICDCPLPPGGTVECEAHQMAVCVIKNGKARHLCLNPIETSDSVKLLNWALSNIMEKDRKPYQNVTARETRILERGAYERKGMSVTFSLPPSVSDALSEIIDLFEGVFVSSGLTCPPFCPR